MSDLHCDKHGVRYFDTAPIPGRHVLVCIGCVIEERDHYKRSLEEIRDFGHDKSCKATMVPIYECGCYKRSQGEIARHALNASSVQDPS